MNEYGILPSVRSDIPVQTAILNVPSALIKAQMKRRKKMNEFLNALKNDTNYGYTENGGIKHNSTMNKVLDMFAMGGSMRNRSEDDIIHMFKCAYGENAKLALRCLFYLRDVRGGQGERRFFRIVLNWMGNHMVEEV